MKKYCFLFMMLCLFTTSQAQNSSLDYKAAIKLYNQSSYEKTTNFYPTSDSTRAMYSETHSAYRFILPGIAFQWKTRKQNFHELELSGIRWDKSHMETRYFEDPTAPGQWVGGQESLTASFAIRYEYIVNFNKKLSSKLVPSLGIGAGTYYSISKLEPKLPNAFPVTQNLIGARVFATPRLSYYFSPKWFLDLNIPICVSDMNSNILTVKNPAFTPNQQTRITTSFTTLPKIVSCRIGVGLKI